MLTRRRCARTRTYCTLLANSKTFRDVQVFGISNLPKRHISNYIFSNTYSVADHQIRRESLMCEHSPVIAMVNGRWLSVLRSTQFSKQTAQHSQTLNTVIALPSLDCVSIHAVISFIFAGHLLFLLEFEYIILVFFFVFVSVLTISYANSLMYSRNRRFYFDLQN